MVEFINFFSSVELTILAGVFTFLFSIIGSSFVFFVRLINKKTINVVLGFAAGIMLSASFWSLLLPSVEYSKANNIPHILPTILGFLGGCGFMYILDRIIPHLHLMEREEFAEGFKTNLNRSILLVLAITLHNIPEGLSIGFIVGSSFILNSPEIYSGVIAITLGIAIQNVPEGMAVSIPLRSGGFSKFRSFYYGIVSGIVEPIAALIGVIFLNEIKIILPYALSFAAGAMIFIVVEELIPESIDKNSSSDFSAIGIILGFSLMMLLELMFY